MRFWKKTGTPKKGYTKAADNAESINLQSFFTRKLQERTKFNYNFKRGLVAANYEIDDDGSFLGTMHRAWKNIKGFFSGNGDKAILEVALLGDKAC